MLSLWSMWSQICLRLHCHYMLCFPLSELSPWLDCLCSPLRPLTLSVPVCLAPFLLSLSSTLISFPGESCIFCLETLILNPRTLCRGMRINKICLATWNLKREWMFVMFALQREREHRSASVYFCVKSGFWEPGLTVCRVSSWSWVVNNE